MNKSTIIPFLFVSWILMLLPLGSSSINIFSLAMAINTVPSIDKENYLQRYEKFYKDDSFREAFYNYHKQHHQQEQQQQQSSHNNYYNYETDHHNNNKKYYATDPKNNIGIPYPYNENNNYDEVEYSSNYESEYSHHTNENNN